MMNEYKEYGIAHGDTTVIYTIMYSQKAVNRRGLDLRSSDAGVAATNQSRPSFHAPAGDGQCGKLKYFPAAVLRVIL
jgi:hypothetical protein